MRPEILMGVAGYAVLIAAQKRASQDIRRRAGELCEVTYGAGSVQCADEQGTLCYNPSLGQVSLAPPGFRGMLRNSQLIIISLSRAVRPTLGTATRVNIALPLRDSAVSMCVADENVPPFRPAANADRLSQGDDPDTCIQNTSVSVQAESNANQTLSKTDTPAAGTLPAVGSFETRDELSGEGNPRRTKVTTPLRTTPGNSNSHAQVQVSVAKKGQWRLLLMGAAIGAVGIFMSSC